MNNEENIRNARISFLLENKIQETLINEEAEREIAENITKLGNMIYLEDGNKICGYRKEDGSWGVLNKGLVLTLRDIRKKMSCTALYAPSSSVYLITPIFYKNDKFECRMMIYVVKNAKIYRNDVIIRPVVISYKEDEIDVLDKLCVIFYGYNSKDEDNEIPAEIKLRSAFWNIDDYFRRRNPEFLSCISNEDKLALTCTVPFSGRIVDQAIFHWDPYMDCSKDRYLEVMKSFHEHVSDGRSCPGGAVESLISYMVRNNCYEIIGGLNKKKTINIIKRILNNTYMENESSYEAKTALCTIIRMNLNNKEILDFMIKETMNNDDNEEVYTSDKLNLSNMLEFTSFRSIYCIFIENELIMNPTENNALVVFKSMCYFSGFSSFGLDEMTSWKKRRYIDNNYDPEWIQDPSYLLTYHDKIDVIKGIPRILNAVITAFSDDHSKRYKVLTVYFSCFSILMNLVGGKSRIATIEGLASFIIKIYAIFEYTRYDERNVRNDLSRNDQGCSLFVENINTFIEINSVFVENNMYVAFLKLISILFMKFAFIIKRTTILHLIKNLIEYRERMTNRVNRKEVIRIIADVIESKCYHCNISNELEQLRE